MDVTNQEQVQAVIEDTAAEAGRLDTVFNNAGIGGTLPFEQATLEDWKKIIDTNVWSVIYGTHAAVPIILDQASGHIVNTGRSPAWSPCRSRPSTPSPSSASPA